MSRDLTTIAAQEQEIRKRLKDLRLAIFNKRESLAASEREEAILLENISELEAEAQEAFARARSIGKGDEVATPPHIAVEDAAVTDAFNIAVTPQESDKTHIFGNGSF